MEGKKATTKIILLLICCVIYAVTNMYDKVNMFILVILAVIVGFAIHYIVEFVFNQVEKYKNK